jgi:putative ABC transport system ATP-binding protein
MSSPPALAVRGFDIRFADRGKVFSAASVAILDVARGETLALTGPSGCGKSTFLYALAGLLPPTSGTISWDGADLFELEEAERDAWRRHNVGFVFQDFELLPELTPLQNLLVPATFERFRIPGAVRRRADRLLEQFAVPSRRAASSLSRGERQRVALARALLFDPKIILADEPTASLDAASGAMVVDALAELARDEGRTVIAASHDPALIARFGAELRLERGRPAAREARP